MTLPDKLFHILLLLLFFFFPLQAQRPILFTENPNSVGDGKLSVGFGVEYLKKDKATPLKAPIWLMRIPVARTYIGVGEIVDVLVDWRGRLFATQGTGKHVSDWGDISIGTKINFLKESRSQPSLAIMYLVKLPNTSHDELLGSNQTDIFLSFLAAKTFGDVHVRANLGLGILDDPEHQHSQLDIYTMSAALILPVGQTHKVFTEWAGFLGSHRDQAKFTARGGIQTMILDAEWSAFGSFRVIGDEKDFGTAFENSETWGVGLFVRKEFSLW
jgi:hypothetical protein